MPPRLIQRTQERLQSNSNSVFFVTRFERTVDDCLCLAIADQQDKVAWPDTPPPKYAGVLALSVCRVRTMVWARFTNVCNRPISIVHFPPCNSNFRWKMVDPWAILTSRTFLISCIPNGQRKPGLSTARISVSSKVIPFSMHSIVHVSYQGALIIKFYHI